MQIVILAAGVGSRLGNPNPKGLTRLDNGETILGRQVSLLRHSFPNASMAAVVGYKKDLIMEEFPELMYIYNPAYGDTNTAKSLLHAFKLTLLEDTLWLNGDVVFGTQMITRLRENVGRGASFACVNSAKVGEEEVKYRLDDSGELITSISKTVSDPVGEAVGINFLSAHDRETVTGFLDRAGQQDYFEKALETAISDEAFQLRAVDITDVPCIEIDFLEDLEAANRLIAAE